MNKDKLKRPQCPSCLEPMIMTFAFAGAEYACLPCGETDQFFCINPRIEVEREKDEQKKELWQDDLHALGVTVGGGECCAKREGGSCKICDNLDGYKYKYYLKGAVGEKKEV